MTGVFVPAAPALRECRNEPFAGVELNPMTRRPLLLGGTAALSLLAAAYLSFELGRHQAGWAVLERQREIEEYERELAASKETIDALEREMTMLETSRDIDRETHAQLEDTLTELQARLQAQEEELAFYRGIMSPSDGVPGLKIRSVQAVPGDGEQSYTLRLVLIQAIVQNQRVNGVVRLYVGGMRDGEPDEIELGEDAGENAEIAYDFRYFQGLERMVRLPEGFEPERLRVEVRPDEPDGDPLTQSFEWSAVAGGGVEVE